MKSNMDSFNELTKEEEMDIFGGEKRGKYIYVNGEIIMVYVDVDED